MSLASRAVVVFALACVAVESVPPCRGNEGEPGRFPIWPATYNAQESSIIQPCNTTGPLSAVHANYGAVSIDWSNWKSQWVVPPMQCEELLVEQAALLKAARPGVRVWVYRNIVKALPWFTSVRTKMDDKNYSDWFLDFKPAGPYHVPQCDDNYSPPKCTNLYHDQEQT